MNVFVSDFISF